MGFTFIDLFAGIGGFHIALKNLGGECVFASEIDKFARQTYEHNLSITPYGNICSIEAESIPDHDILAAGFPCQPFSNSGISKNKSLSKPTGVQDPRGRLFNEIIRIAEVKQPKFIFLENVKNLQRQKVFPEMLESLQSIGYSVSWRIVSAINYVPQKRERLIIVAKLGETPFTNWPSEKTDAPPHLLAEILEPDPDDSYILSEKAWLGLQRHKERHQSKGAGFGYCLVNKDTPAFTLTANYYKTPASQFVDRGEGKIPRKFTILECKRLMGFPEWFEVPVSRTQAYKQFGNAVVVPKIQAVAEKIILELPLI